MISGGILFQSAKPLFILPVNISNNDTHDKFLQEFNAGKLFSDEALIYYFLINENLFLFNLG